MTESTITTAIIRAIRARGFWARKVHGNAYQSAGLPDIDAVVYGRSVRIEVKRPGETPTPIQLAVMAELGRAGALVSVATSVEDAMAFLDSVLARIPEAA